MTNVVGMVQRFFQSTTSQQPLPCDHKRLPINFCEALFALALALAGRAQFTPARTAAPLAAADSTAAAVSAGSSGCGPPGPGCGGPIPAAPLAGSRQTGAGLRPAQPFMVYVGFVLAALLIYTHRANIGRLRSGTESRVPMFGRK